MAAACAALGDMKGQVGKSGIRSVCAALAPAAMLSACAPAWRDSAWDGYGMRPMMWHFPFMGLFGFLGVFLVVLAALFVFRWLTGGAKGSNAAHDHLKSRYAKGEISREDFERMKKDLDT